MKRSISPQGIASLILVLIVSLIGSACASSSAPPAKPTSAAPPAQATVAAPATNPEPKPAKVTSIKVGLPATTSDAGIYIAIEKGYFKEQQIEVGVEIFDSAVKMIPALATGQIAVAGGSMGASLFNAIKRDIPLKIVADKGSGREKSGASAMIVRKDLIDSGAIKDFKDLKGKTYAVSAAGNSHHIDISRALEKGGLTLDDAKSVEMAFPDMTAAFANKSIDFAMQIEPLVTVAVEKGLVVRWKNENEIYPNHEAAVILYSPKFAEDDSDVAKRFMVAYLKGVRDYVNAFSKGQGKDQVVAVLTKYTNVKDAKVFDRMMPAGLNPDGYVDLASISYDQDWLIKHGYMSEGVDLNKAVDNQYVDYAIKILGKYQ